MSSYINSAFSLLKILPYESRIVGGAVRDFVRNKSNDIKDIDIATVATPDEIIDFANKNKIKSIPTGLQHGTVTLIFEGHHFEITTLRKDVNTDGRHADVEFTNNWEEDAERRDFTFNAMYMDKNTKIYDYFDGKRDLKEGIVRFIGDPLKRIDEDYLRMLRFFRFHTYLGKRYDDGSFGSVVVKQNEITKISKERIKSELFKILAHKNAHKTLFDMREIGFLQKIVHNSFVENVKDVKSNNPIVKLAAMSIYNHTDATLLKNDLKLSNEEYKILYDIGYGMKDRIYSDFSDYNKLMYLFGKDAAYNIMTVGNSQKLVSNYKYRKFLSVYLAWDIPNFPVKSSDLFDLGFKSGKFLVF